LGHVEESVVHVDTCILEVSRVAGRIGGDVKDGSDDNTDLEVLKLGSNAVDEQVGS
jgi:hypothetical protein